MLSLSTWLYCLGHGSVKQNEQTIWLLAVFAVSAMQCPGGSNALMHLIHADMTKKEWRCEEG